MAFATLITMNFAMAQTVFHTESASINPSEIFVTDDSDVFTVITWNDASELTNVELDFWGYIFELEENVDYIISEIDEFSSLFEFIDEEDFKKKAGIEKFDDPWYINFYFDAGSYATLTIYPEWEVQYGVMFSIADYLGNSIDDAVVTFDGYTFNPGEYDLGFYFSGSYYYSIEKYGYETITGEIIIDESAISEHFVMYPSVVYSMVSFHLSSQGMAVDQAVIQIDGLDEALHTNHEGMAFMVLATGTHTYTVSADGYHPQEGVFDLEETDLDISLELDVATHTTISHNITVNVYPNPASNHITIKLTEGGTHYLDVYSSEGKLMHAQLMEESSVGLDLSVYPTGFYYVRIKTGETFQTVKFIKY